MEHRKDIDGNKIETTPNLLGLRKRYLDLGNKILPAKISYPVSRNHCFFRVILDYIAGCKWDTKFKKPGYKQLTEAQLFLAIHRMESWLKTRELLIEDNKQSLRYRNED